MDSVSRRERVKAHSLASILLEAGVVNEDQIEAGLELRQQTGKRIGEALVELGAVTEVDLGWALARQLGLQFVDLDPNALDHDLIKSFPDGLLRRLQAVPLIRAERNLSVALADPTDSDAVSELVRVARCPLHPSVATPSAIDASLDAVLGAAPEAHRPAPAPDGTSPRFDVEWDRSGATYLLFHISRAQRSEASEVHFVPHGGELRVYHRIAGELVQEANEPYEVMFSLLSRIETLNGPSIDDRVVHAFGQILCPIGDQELPIDVSLLNVDGGIAVTLGLRPATTQPKQLEDLELPPVTAARMRELLERPVGLILVSGPARSGGSTTLECLMGALAATRRSLLIESAPGPRLDVAPRVVLDEARALAQWGEIAVGQNADVVGLGDVLRGEHISETLSSAASGRLLIAVTNWLDSFALIEHLSNGAHARTLLARRLHLVIQQRRVRVRATGKGKTATPIRTVTLFETLFVTEPMRAAIAAGDGRDRIRRIAEADGFRALEDLVAELRAAGRLDDAEAARALS